MALVITGDLSYYVVAFLDNNSVLINSSDPDEYLVVNEYLVL